MQPYRRSADALRAVTEHFEAERRKRMDAALAYWRPFFDQEKKKEQEKQDDNKSE